MAANLRKGVSLVKHALDKPGFTTYSRTNDTEDIRSQIFCSTFFKNNSAIISEMYV